MSWLDNDESATSTRALDRDYGKGHRPEPSRVGYLWQTGCTCSATCERAELPGVWLDTHDEARAESARLLTLAEHRPGAGQETSA